MHFLAIKRVLVECYMIEHDNTSFVSHRHARDCIERSYELRFRLTTSCYLRRLAYKYFGYTNTIFTICFAYCTSMLHLIYFIKTNTHCTDATDFLYQMSLIWLISQKVLYIFKFVYKKKTFSIVEKTSRPAGP